MDRNSDIQSVCGAPGEDRREAVLCNDLLGRFNRRSQNPKGRAEFVTQRWKPNIL